MIPYQIGAPGNAKILPGSILTLLIADGGPPIFIELPDPLGLDQHDPAGRIGRKPVGQDASG